ncbi:unnamed protein product [Phaeothamnion confervicola]
MTATAAFLTGDDPTANGHGPLFVRTRTGSGGVFSGWLREVGGLLPIFGPRRTSSQSMHTKRRSDLMWSTAQQASASAGATGHIGDGGAGAAASASSSSAAVSGAPGGAKPTGRRPSAAAVMAVASAAMAAASAAAAASRSANVAAATSAAAAGASSAAPSSGQKGAAAAAGSAAACSAVTAGAAGSQIAADFESGGGSDQEEASCPYISPAALRDQLEELLQRHSEKAFTLQGMLQLAPTLLWNLWWLCARFGLPLPLPPHPGGYPANEAWVLVGAWDRLTAQRAGGGVLAALESAAADYKESGRLAPVQKGARSYGELSAAGGGGGAGGGGAGGGGDNGGSGSSGDAGAGGKDLLSVHPLLGPRCAAAEREVRLEAVRRVPGMAEAAAAAEIDEVPMVRCAKLFVSAVGGGASGAAGTNGEWKRREPGLYRSLLLAATAPAPPTTRQLPPHYHGRSGGGGGGAANAQTRLATTRSCIPSPLGIDKEHQPSAAIAAAGGGTAATTGFAPGAAGRGVAGTALVEGSGKGGNAQLQSPAGSVKRDASTAAAPRGPLLLPEGEAPRHPHGGGGSGPEKLAVQVTSAVGGAGAADAPTCRGKQRRAGPAMDGSGGSGGDGSASGGGFRSPSRSPAARLRNMVFGSPRGSSSPAPTAAGGLAVTPAGFATGAANAARAAADGLVQPAGTAEQTPTSVAATSPMVASAAAAAAAATAAVGVASVAAPAAAGAAAATARASRRRRNHLPALDVRPPFDVSFTRVLATLSVAEAEALLPADRGPSDQALAYRSVFGHLY